MFNVFLPQCLTPQALAYYAGTPNQFSCSTCEMVWNSYDVLRCHMAGKPKVRLEWTPLAKGKTDEQLGIVGKLEEDGPINKNSRNSEIPIPLNMEVKAEP